MKEAGSCSIEKTTPKKSGLTHRPDVAAQQALIAEAEAERVDVVVAQVDQGVEGVDVILRQLLLHSRPARPADLLPDDIVHALRGLGIALCLLVAARLFLMRKVIPEVPDGLHEQSKRLGWECQ